MRSITLLLYAELFILVALSLISDFKTDKVKNHIVLPFIPLGMLTNFLYDGFDGLIRSAAGAVVPLALLIALFALRMLGAGDIKLFCAIGAISGTQFVLYSIAFSFISGGLIALVLIAYRRNARARLAHMFSYMKTCFLSHSFQPYTSFEDRSDGAKFHFTLAIAIGTVIASANFIWLS